MLDTIFDDDDNDKSFTVYKQTICTCMYVCPGWTFGLIGYPLPNGCTHLRSLAPSLLACHFDNVMLYVESDGIQVVSNQCKCESEEKMYICRSNELLVRLKGWGGVGELVDYTFGTCLGQ